MPFECYGMCQTCQVLNDVYPEHAEHSKVHLAITDLTSSNRCACGDTLSLSLIDAPLAFIRATPTQGSNMAQNMHFQIKDHRNDTKILYEGDFLDMRLCLEQAVKDNVDLSYAYLVGKQLRMGRFDGAKLFGAQFIDSNLDHTSFNGADLRDTIWDYANIAYSYFKKADLTNASFGGSVLVEADFTDANLKYVNFHQADCSKCKFRGADLYGVNISRRAQFGGADLRGALNCEIRPHRAIGVSFGR